MLFSVSFKKMESNLGVIIIGAEITHSDVNFFPTWQPIWQVTGVRRHRSWRRPPLTAGSGAIQGGRRQDLWRRPPGTCHIACHVGKVGTNYVGATMRYLGANDDDAEVRVHFLKWNYKGYTYAKKPKMVKIQKVGYLVSGELKHRPSLGNFSSRKIGGVSRACN
jgi:hypothetical protein